jgi:hypothetical protein
LLYLYLSCFGVGVVQDAFVEHELQRRSAALEEDISQRLSKLMQERRDQRATQEHTSQLNQQIISLTADVTLAHQQIASLHQHIDATSDESSLGQSRFQALFADKTALDNEMTAQVAATRRTASALDEARAQLAQIKEHVANQEAAAKRDLSHSAQLLEQSVANERELERKSAEHERELAVNEARFQAALEKEKHALLTARTVQADRLEVATGKSEQVRLCDCGVSDVCFLLQTVDHSFFSSPPCVSHSTQNTMSVTTIFQSMKKG